MPRKFHAELNLNQVSEEMLKNLCKNILQKENKIKTLFCLIDSEPMIAFIWLQPFNCRNSIISLNIVYRKKVVYLICAL
jgi:hypothetical protein